MMGLKGFFKKREKTPVEIDILSMIALLAKEENWCQGFMINNNGKAHCLYGAWYCLHNGSPQTLKYLDYLIREKKFSKKKVSLLGPLDIDNIVKWNDVPERTHAEVLEFLKEALKKLGWKL